MKRLSNINESVWSDIHKRSNGFKIKQENDNNNLRKLKPVDLGKYTTVYWADSDLVYDNNEYFTYDEVFEIIKDSEWRLPTLKEVAELDVFSNTNKITPNNYGDRYVIWGENDKQLIFFNNGLIHHQVNDRITDKGRYYYGWTSDLYGNGSAQIFTFWDFKIIHTPENSKRVVDQVIHSLDDKLSVRLVKDK